MSAYGVPASLNIQLPEVAAPAAAYLPYVQTGRLLFLAGHISKKYGIPFRGRLGADLTTGQDREAARLTAIDLLSTLHVATGDLDRITRIVNLMVLVNSTDDFTEQHLVANGASELVSVFGESGRHTRAAYGVAQIPLGCCVEITLIAEIA